MSGVCPFGEDLQRYWNMRHQLFERFDEGIQIDAEGLHSVLPETVCMTIAENIQSKNIIDAFAGVGGMSIALARAGKKITAIEIDVSRFAIAKHNAMIYQVDHQIDFICNDIFKALPTLSGDAIILDPPWGWPSKKKLANFLFEHFLVNIKELINLSLRQFKEVILHVPTIFDLSELDCFEREFKVKDNVFNGRVISKVVFFGCFIRS